MIATIATRPPHAVPRASGRPDAADVAFVPVRPGARHGARPERARRHETSRPEAFLQGRLAARRPGLGTFAAASRLIGRVRASADELRAADELARARRRRALGALRRAPVVTGDELVEVFAHVVVECEALYGVTLHDEQLFAGRAMLAGALVEMRTGEGKTLAAALAATLAGLTGTPVHAITANDYLAARDAALLEPLYARFGLSVGVATDTVPAAARREAYRRDVVHCAVQRLVFDHLEDGGEMPAPRPGTGTRLGPLFGAPPAPARLRGLCFAIVDEADDVLVDGARTPLVLSRAADPEPTTRARAAVALALARSLHEGVDFRLDAGARVAALSAAGADAVDLQAGRLGGDWTLARYRHELVRQALTALHGFVRERDYLVRDGRVVLIDPGTGRARSEQRLRHGLHQLLELKEGCSPSSRTEVFAALGVQRFFGRYHRVAGTSGTLAECRAELATVYGLPVVAVPPHRPCLLRRLPDAIAPDADARFAMLRARILRCRDAGRPVLVGTRTLALAREIGERLSAEGIEHRRLDARQDADEAHVIGTAGEPGAVTVATNVAGRGADIPLHPRAREAGGLHVIALELNESARVDRQLFGRAARQGDPGSCERLLCPDDAALEGAVPAWLVRLARVRASSSGPARRLASLPFRLARRRLAARNLHRRLDLFHRTEGELRQLAVAGRTEASG